MLPPICWTPWDKSGTPIHAAVAAVATAVATAVVATAAACDPLRCPCVGVSVGLPRLPNPIVLSGGCGAVEGLPSGCLRRVALHTA